MKDQKAKQTRHKKTKKKEMLEFQHKKTINKLNKNED